MEEPTNDQVQKFLKELMDIQRTFATEQKNAKSSRLDKLRGLLEKHVAEGASDAD